MERALKLALEPQATCLHPPLSGCLRTLAVMADCHDEAFMLTRLCDTDGFEISDLHDGLERCL